MNNTNNELSHAVNLFKKNPEKLEIYEKVKSREFNIELEETKKYNFDKEGFDEGGLHKDTGTKYNFEGLDEEGFDKEGLHKDTKNKYDPNGFDKEGLHKDTKNKYDPNGFDKKRLHKDTKNKYDPNGFDKKRLHKDTNTFLDKEKNIRKDKLENINWLND